VRSSFAAKVGVAGDGEVEEIAVPKLPS